LRNFEGSRKSITLFRERCGNVTETNTLKVTDRLKADGWVNIGGGKHDKYEHPDRPGTLVIVPRHKE